MRGLRRKKLSALTAATTPARTFQTPLHSLPNWKFPAAKCDSTLRLPPALALCGQTEAGLPSKNKKENLMAKPFNGVIKLDIRDSKADWTPYELKRAPAGAPNILI